MKPYVATFRDAHKNIIHNEVFDAEDSMDAKALAMEWAEENNLLYATVHARVCVYQRDESNIGIRKGKVGRRTKEEVGECEQVQVHYYLDKETYMRFHRLAKFLGGRKTAMSLAKEFALMKLESYCDKYKIK